MGRLFLIDLEGIFYSCLHCNTPLAFLNEFISEVSEIFQGRHGRTLLFNNVVNVTFGEEKEWEMMGGLHTVDMFCVKCGSDVGWKFLSAQEQIEQYKIEKFILERVLLQLRVTTLASAIA